MTFIRHFHKNIHYVWPSTLAAGLVLAVSGCSTPKPDKASSPTEATTSDFLDLAATTTNAITSNSIQMADFKPPSPSLAPGLIVGISVLVSGQKEIDEPTKRISNNGELNLPLVGNVRVRGMTLEELSVELQKRYQKYFVDPQVVVEFVRDQNSDLISPWGYVTVLGRVKTPGRVNIPPTQDLTVSSAIQQAGGLDTSARDSAIKITRRNIQGQSEQYEVNLRNVGSKGYVQDDLLLKSGDVVFVPEMIF
jgi:protein involved in polysaccharide export with SLBB domain